jgi:preprotein translocase subunit YajC
MGTIYLAGVIAAKSKSSSSIDILFVVIVVGIFYMLVLRPQRARQRKAMQVQGQVMPGQRVRTTAGMYGTVVSGDDRDVVIEIAPGVHVTMLRRAVSEVLPDDAVTDFGDADSAQEHPDGTPPDDWDLKDGTPPDDWDVKDHNN